MKKRGPPKGYRKGEPSPLRGGGKAFAWLYQHVNYSGDDCLRWPFHIDSRVGRGRLGHNGKLCWAHRVMCELAHGHAPEGKPQAAHNCGNGHLGCVNPKHLEWKSNQENCQDKSLHGRSRNKAGKRDLLPAEILEIKFLKGKMAQTAIAERFGVSLSCVQYHLHGKERWPSHAKTISHQQRLGEKK